MCEAADRGPRPRLCHQATYGFIQPDDGRNRVYYNSAAVVGGVGLFSGDRVSYFLGAAPDYRLRACEVTLLGTRG